MMHWIKSFLATLVLLAFAATASAATVSCGVDGAAVCDSSIAAPHCPAMPDKDIRTHLYCGPMCTAIAPSAHSVRAPVSVDAPVAQLPSVALLGTNNGPEPPPPRG